jgi:hypothetical protein
MDGGAATADPGDCYYKIVSADPVIAYSVRSWDCVIDRSSGRHLGKSIHEVTRTAGRLRGSLAEGCS